MFTERLPLPGGVEGVFPTLATPDDHLCGTRASPCHGLLGRYTFGDRLPANDVARLEGHVAVLTLGDVPNLFTDPADRSRAFVDRGRLFRVELVRHVRRLCFEGADRSSIDGGQISRRF